MAVGVATVTVWLCLVCPASRWLTYVRGSHCWLAVWGRTAHVMDGFVACSWCLNVSIFRPCVVPMAFWV